MKSTIAAFSLLIAAYACAADHTAAAGADSRQDAAVHRYIIERTFPEGALKNLDADAKDKVNKANATVGVRWIESYANADKTKTFCVYEGPSEAAVRKAATLNKLPVDRVTEVPVTIESK